MKWICVVALSTLLFSCQKEEFRIVEEENTEASILEDQILTNLITSVSSHDGSFDDVVDRSPCFSIQFPYSVYQGDVLIEINSEEDLTMLNDNAEITPVFPLSITLATYDELDVPTETAFNNYIAMCANGEMFNDRIVCIDFSYPISISMFLPADSTFETIVLNHDRDVFTEIESFEGTEVVNLQYPITLLYLDGTSTSINSNDELKAVILEMIPVCN